MAQNQFTKENAKNGMPGQVILNAGLNVFGLQLVLESFKKIAGKDATPIEFIYLGVKVKFQIAD